jgi:hypothetical protein
MERDDLIGRRCYEAFAASREPCTDCPVAEAMRTGRPQQVEKQMSDGSVLFIQGSPVQDDKGNVIGGVEITLDVTGHRNTVEAV